MKNKILIRKPSKSFGNVGDIALIETIKKEFKTKSIVYDIPDVNEISIKNVDEFTLPRVSQLILKTNQFH